MTSAKIGERMDIALIVLDAFLFGTAVTLADEVVGKRGIGAGLDQTNITKKSVTGCVAGRGKVFLHEILFVGIGTGIEDLILDTLVGFITARCLDNIG